jgi:hypothetical protein
VLLYDLKNDPSEKHNAAASHPEIVERLQARFAEWNRQNVEPPSTSRTEVHTAVNGLPVQLIK